MNDSPKLGAGEILDLMGVEDMPRVHVVGVSEQRVTILAQQTRALNLIYALHTSGRINADSRVAVVGGGIAGLTAAAGALALGCDVVVLEKLPRLLAIQAGCRTRWLHPHIYDWPNNGWSGDRAELPLLDWSAANAASVIEQLRRSWADVERHACGRVSAVTGCSDIELSPSAMRVSVSWNAQGETPGFKLEEFDEVIFAVGYGVERQYPGNPSYWRDDDLHQDFIGHILISGTGDGGLTDTLRASLTDFEHDHIFSLARTAQTAKLVEDINYAVPLMSAKAAADFYFTMPIIDELRTELRRHLRLSSSYRVTLNASSQNPFETPSSALNRVLVRHLFDLGVTYWRRTVLGVDQISARDVEVEVERADGNHEKRTFNRVIRRYGASEPPINDWPDIASRRRLSPEVLRRLQSALDRSRIRSWPDDYFDQGSLGASRRRAAPIGKHAVSPSVDAQPNERPNDALATVINLPQRAGSVPELGTNKSVAQAAWQEFRAFLVSRDFDTISPQGMSATADAVIEEIRRNGLLSREAPEGVHRLCVALHRALQRCTNPGAADFVMARSTASEFRASLINSLSS